MTTNPDLTAFLKRWRSCLRRGNLDAFWEGEKAYAQVVRKGDLALVRIEGDVGADIAQRAVIAEICAELKIYRQNIKQVRTQLQSDRFLKEWLLQQAAAFRKKALPLSSPVLKGWLSNLAQEIEKGLEFVDYAARKRWFHPFTAQHLGLKDRPTQEREIDGRFQVRLARLFRRYLLKENGLSLATIARLVVLFLYCADLAKISTDGHGLMLAHNGRPVDVPAVLQKLRRSRLK